MSATITDVWNLRLFALRMGAASLAARGQDTVHSRTAAQQLCFNKELDAAGTP